MSNSYYPKNWNANGIGWYNPHAMQIGFNLPDNKSVSSSSGVSSLSGNSNVYPPSPISGANLSYGFAPGIIAWFIT